MKSINLIKSGCRSVLARFKVFLANGIKFLCLLQSKANTEIWEPSSFFTPLCRDQILATALSPCISILSPTVKGALMPDEVMTLETVDLTKSVKKDDMVLVFLWCKCVGVESALLCENSLGYRS